MYLCQIELSRGCYQTICQFLDIFCFLNTQFLKNCKYLKLRTFLGNMLV
jgi:hypothetical protein